MCRTSALRWLLMALLGYPGGYADATSEAELHWDYNWCNLGVELGLQYCGKGADGAFGRKRPRASLKREALSANVRETQRT